MEGYQWGEVVGRVGEKVTGTKKHKWQVQNRWGVVVKNTMGNGEAKELLCMTHGHELGWGINGGRWVQGGGE